MSDVKEGTTLCPLISSRNAAVTCGKGKCEWWNTRFERCSVYVIGDRIDDLAIAMGEEKEVEPNV